MVRQWARCAVESRRSNRSAQVKEASSFGEKFSLLCLPTVTINILQQQQQHHLAVPARSAAIFKDTLPLTTFSSLSQRQHPRPGGNTRSRKPHGSCKAESQAASGSAQVSTQITLCPVRLNGSSHNTLVIGDLPVLFKGTLKSCAYQVHACLNIQIQRILFSVHK